MSRERRLSLALLVLLAGCGGSGEETAATVDTAPVLAAPAPAAGDTTCPATGLWAHCSVFRSIERAGLNSHRDSAKEVTELPLSISGMEVPIARGDIRIFVYADSGSRKRDQAKLDRKQFVLPHQQPGIQRERTLVGSANLLVLMNVINSLSRERIANALMAGPPQPPSKRP
ncbi:MAG TPA: hypothetical protein VFO55_09775 [Gemmatimonadaceae bacterium]|nr:hypothetical protein [Gemmatimonadaceae bacterium]